MNKEICFLKKKNETHYILNFYKFKIYYGILEISFFLYHGSRGGYGANAWEIGLITI